jgi:hypothetical protein
MLFGRPCHVKLCHIKENGGSICIYLCRDVAICEQCAILLCQNHLNFYEMITNQKQDVMQIC